MTFFTRTVLGIVALFSVETAALDAKLAQAIDAYIHSATPVVVNKPAPVPAISLRVDELEKRFEGIAPIFSAIKSDNIELQKIKLPEKDELGAGFTAKITGILNRAKSACCRLAKNPSELDKTIDEIQSKTKAQEPTSK